MTGFLGRLLGGEPRTPELVCWSANIKGHTSDEAGKNIIHGDIILSLSAPSFGADCTWIYVVVSNLGRKALGFGAPGFGLVLTTGNQKTTITCQALIEKQRGTRRVDIYNERRSQNLMVDVGEVGIKGVQFVAEFPPSPQPDQAELAIQINRILAPALLFYFPFVFSPSTSKSVTTVSSPDQTFTNSTLPHTFCTQCGAKLQVGSQFCHRCGASQKK